MLYVSLVVWRWKTNTHALSPHSRSRHRFSFLFRVEANSNSYMCNNFFFSLLHQVKINVLLSWKHEKKNYFCGFCSFTLFISRVSFHNAGSISINRRAFHGNLIKTFNWFPSFYVYSRSQFISNHSNPSVISITMELN